MFVNIRITSMKVKTSVKKMIVLKFKNIRYYVKKTSLLASFQYVTVNFSIVIAVKKQQISTIRGLSQKVVDFLYNKKTIWSIVIKFYL